MSVATEMMRKLQGIDPKLSELLLSIAEEIDKRQEAWEASVIQHEFAELRQAVHDLTLAQKRTEEQVKELAAAQKRTDERLDRLTERIEELTAAQKRTDERMDALAKAQENTERMMQQGFQKVFDKIAALGSRWGIQTEDVFRRTIETLLNRQGLTVRRGYYGRREVDVVIRNGTHLLLEITSFLRQRDVDKLLASAQDYEEETGQRPELLIAASYVPPSVMRHLLACGREFELISYEEEEEE